VNLLAAYRIHELTLEVATHSEVVALSNENASNTRAPKDFLSLLLSYA
jgi:hypothetical protein